MFAQADEHHIQKHKSPVLKPGIYLSLFLCKSLANSLLLGGINVLTYEEIMEPVQLWHGVFSTNNS